MLSVAEIMGHCPWPLQESSYEHIHCLACAVCHRDHGTLPLAPSGRFLWTCSLSGTCCCIDHGVLPLAPSSRFLWTCSSCGWPAAPSPFSPSWWWGWCSSDLFRPSWPFRTVSVTVCDTRLCVNYVRDCVCILLVLLLFCFVCVCACCCDVCVFVWLCVHVCVTVGAFYSCVCFGVCGDQPVSVSYTHLTLPTSSYV